MNTPVVEKKPRLTTSAMIASIASEGQRVKAAPFGKALVEYAASRPNVVGMTADLAKYTDLHLFAQAYPERFFQMGMAEQLLMGAAGGMAKQGAAARQKAQEERIRTAETRRAMLMGMHAGKGCNAAPAVPAVAATPATPAAPVASQTPTTQ